jgi:serine/threonine protein kinase
MIGKTIGNYRIVTELAKGGMGAVYRAHHLHLPREVVVKSIN